MCSTHSLLGSHSSATLMMHQEPWPSLCPSFVAFCWSSAIRPGPSMCGSGPRVSVGAHTLLTMMSSADNQTQEQWELVKSAKNSSAATAPAMAPAVMSEGLEDRKQDSSGSQGWDRVLPSVSGSSAFKVSGAGPGEHWASPFAFS